MSAVSQNFLKKENSLKVETLSCSECDPSADRGPFFRVYVPISVSDSRGKHARWRT